MKRAILLVLAACGGEVFSEPSTVVAAVYTDETCAARPAAVAAFPADELVTVEPGWHYDGSDPKVRRFDGRKPSWRRKVCWRSDGPSACPCRVVEPGEAVYEALVP